MKSLKIILGTILIVAGIFLAYQGYLTSTTKTAAVERETSAILQKLSNNKVDVKQEANNKANLLLLGGSGGAVIGIVLVVSSFIGKKK